jgi:hypothetical protein
MIEKLTDREKSCRRGRLRPRQNNLEDVHQSTNRVLLLGSNNNEPYYLNLLFTDFSYVPCTFKF